MGEMGMTWGLNSRGEREESLETMLWRRERRKGEGGERKGAWDCFIYLKIACRSEGRRGGGGWWFVL
jgi:hypothetical protein